MLLIGNKMEDRYTIKIFWSVLDNTFIADVEELQGCSAFGDTREEALKEVRTAMGLWLESAREHGDKIPEPIFSKILA